MARVDIEDAKESSPKAWKMTGMQSDYFKEWFNAQPANIRLAHCKGVIRQKLSKHDCLNDRKLQTYIDRALEILSTDQLADLEQSPFSYALKVDKKVNALLTEHCAKNFNLWLEQDKIVCKPSYKLPSAISPITYISTIPNSLYAAEETMNDNERRVVWQISSMDNVKWWHRNISQLGFQINGSTHAYPDIMVMTQSGKLLMIETKDDYLDNADSKEKARIGSKWAALSGSNFRYFMVFESKQPDYSGAYSYDRFIEILRGL